MERLFIPIVATLAGIISPANCQESSTYTEGKTSPDDINEEKICEITNKKNIQEIIKNLRRHINKLRGSINPRCYLIFWISVYG